MSEHHTSPLITVAALFLVGLLAFLAYQYVQEKDAETLSISVDEDSISVD